MSERSQKDSISTASCGLKSYESNKVEELSTDMVRDAAISSDSEHDRKPMPKKQKPKTTVKSDSAEEKEVIVAPKIYCGYRGALKQLPEMPLDIQLEIFRNLDPLDLVNLTRATKSLRNMLLNDSASGVWKEAHGNVVDLPECPDDMSEPQFATLIFETHCQKCLSKMSHICWDFRLRLCFKCVESDYRFMSAKQTQFINFEVLLVCPKVTFNSDGPNVGYYDAVGEDARSRWEYYELKQFFKIIKVHEWLKTREDERTQKLENMRKRRVAEIIKRLTDLGWGEVIENLPYDRRIQNHSLSWNNICPRLIEFMEKHKA
ncbi:hypothetical protein BDQ17DRAFT_1364174 [Cyathus striatus]|nr:hypothetical protein BDQ17DRAFT_1364174 [Cyathus striatus]